MSDRPTNWQTRVDSRMTSAFIETLRKQFDLGAIGSNVRTELQNAAAFYFRDLEIFSNDEIQFEKRKQYKRLKAETIRYRSVLTSDEFEDLESDLCWAALHNNDESKNPDISEIANLQPVSGKAYLLEIERLLGLLEKTADLGIERFAPLRGPKRKYALENLVRRLAYIWSNLLERAFTLDYHKGSGLSDAFRFASAFVAQLDESYTETQIVTAMRTIIAERGL